MGKSSEDNHGFKRTKMPENASTVDASVNGQTVVVMNPSSSDNATEKARIPCIDKLSDLYKYHDLATKVHSLLDRDDMSICFPVIDAIGGLTSGGIVTYSFIYLGALV
ncbi:hypothetical protein L195_g001381 [Trifolium pratense]|uniref:Uncharacterized protein n=1 Tax=Trifolium pratense TaxID=57577 RepID=A0A2K3NPI9_TRIPR|nr:hypothetical protein L195_g001381 [Trifolium pratense]